MKIFIYDENRVLMRTVGTPDIMQGENNATLIFMSVAGIDESNFQNYLAQFAATIGTSHPADIITDFGTYVLDGVEYKGWRYFVSSKFTQVAGALNANLILSSGGSTLISQTVTLNVNPSASGQTWNQNIDLAKWYQLLAYTIGLKNPKVGVIADSYLDTYNSEGQAGSYFYFGEDGVPHLLFVGYNEDDDLIAQTDYYSDGGAMYCRSRTFSDGEWTEWETSDQASAISVNVTGLPQLTGANTVQKAIAALSHAVYPIAFVTSLTPSPFTSVDVPNSKDKIIKDDLGQDLNAGGVLDYAFAIFGRYNTHAFGFDNTLIMTSDGAIYRMKYENGSMVAHWFNGSPAQVKAEQALINQTLSEGIAANNNLIKNNVVGMVEITTDSDTYVITLTIKNLNGQVIATSSVDIPAEMAFVSGRYDAEDRDLIFTLQNGNEVAVPVDDIFVGLATQDWVNTAIANALLPYATTSWVDSNYMSLTKGGVVNLANPPASGSTFYFGAKNGTTSLFEVSDHAILGKVTGNTGDVWHFLMNGNANSAPIFTHIIPASDDNPTRTTQYKLPLNVATGSHDLVIDDDLDEANEKITALESKTAKQESDIQYLYRQVIGGGDLVTETDSGVALTSQNFPLTVSPKALLDYVGGMCQKVNQLVVNGNFADTSGWQRINATTSAQNNKLTISVIASSTITQVYRYVPVTANRTYLVSAYMTASVNVQSAILRLGRVDDSPRANLTANTKTRIVGIKTVSSSDIDEQGRAEFNFFFASSSGLSANDTVIVENATCTDITDAYPTDTPTSTSDARIQWLMSYLSSHPEYDAGSIITAPVTKVVSKGFNLFDEETEIGGINSTYGTDYSTNTRIRSKNYCGCLPNTIYYFYCGGNQEVGIAWYDKDKNFVSWDYSYSNGTKTSPSNARYFRIQKYDGYGTTYNHDICINVSNASLNGTYMPYRAPIEYPIPAEVQALEGYGYGIDNTLYNYIDFERKMFVKKVARVVLNNLPVSFIYYVNGLNCWEVDLASAGLPLAKDNGNSGLPIVMWTEGTEVTYWYDSNKGDKGKITVRPSGDKKGCLELGTGDTTTRPTGVVYYELATPVETDISEYIESDVIEVSAGGRLEFENEDDMGVPYSATYQCEPETQGGE